MENEQYTASGEGSEGTSKCEQLAVLYPGFKRKVWLSSSIFYFCVILFPFHKTACLTTFLDDRADIVLKIPIQYAPKLDDDFPNWRITLVSKANSDILEERITEFPLEFIFPTAETTSPALSFFLPRRIYLW